MAHRTSGLAGLQTVIMTSLGDFVDMEPLASTCWFYAIAVYVVETFGCVPGHLWTHRHSPLDAVGNGVPVIVHRAWTS